MHVAGTVHPVVISFGSPTDLIMLTPLLRLLHERYGSACVLGTGIQASGLFSTHPHIAHLFYLGDPGLCYRLSPRQWSFVRYLRAPRPGPGPGPIHVCTRDGHDKARELLGRAGLGADRVIYDADPPTDKRLHWIDRWLALGLRTPAAYCIAQADPDAIVRPDPHRYRPMLAVRRKDQDHLERWLQRQGFAGRPLILVHPACDPIGPDRSGDSRAVGRTPWPLERWVQLCERMQNDLPRAQLLLVGTTSRALLRSIQALARCDLPIVAAAPHRFLALQQRAMASLSVDAGPAHSATALGCAAIVLGAADPQQQPRAGDHGEIILVRTGAATRDLSDLSLDEVVEAWRMLLRRVIPQPGSHGRSCGHSVPAVPAILP